MDYNRYQCSRDLSWRILIGGHIAGLPINVSQICFAQDIVVRSYAQAAETIHVLGLEQVCRASDGISFARNHELYILFNSARPVRRIRFTIAHELGHCLLHHNGMNCTKPLLRINVCRDVKNLERQANTFAADLLAPACVLWGLNVSTAAEIAAYCNISMPAAQIRLTRLQTLIKRNAELQTTGGRGCFLLSPLERQVYEQFQPYIEEKKNQSKNDSGCRFSFSKAESKAAPF